MFSRSRPDDRTRLKSYWKGRGGRAEYWLAIGAFTAVGMLFPGFSGAAAIGPMLVFTIRRLHDFGRSGWWSLLPLGVAIPIAVAIVAVPVAALLMEAVLIVGSVMFTAFVGLMPGDAGSNRFGEPEDLFRRKRADLKETFS